MKPTMTIHYYEDSYGLPLRDIVVLKESRMAPAPAVEGLSGIWEYFDVHEPLDEIHTYGVDENGFLFAFTDTHFQLWSQKECKIYGEWYNRAQRLKLQAQS